MWRRRATPFSGYDFHTSVDDRPFDTCADLAGGKAELALPDTAGRVVNAIYGAVFSLMAQGLPGLECLESTMTT